MIRNPLGKPDRLEIRLSQLKSVIATKASPDGGGAGTETLYPKNETVKDIWFGQRIRYEMQRYMRPGLA